MDILRRCIAAVARMGMYVVSGMILWFPSDLAFAQVDMGEPAECSLPVVREIFPTFPGGEKACAKYVAGHLVYPGKAKENRIRGTVSVEVTVAADGSIQAAKVVKSKLSRKPQGGATDAVSGASSQVSPEEVEKRKAVLEECGKLLEDEALRIVRSMPKWEPGTRDGKPVEMKHTLSVKFKL